jgi:polysaccharide pyruvyl transferase WcaK-like protein
MQLLINPGTHSCLNMGDLAMLQVAYERVRGLWPDATVRVLAADSAALECFCPGAIPVPVTGLHQWNAEHPLLGQRGKLLPAPLRGIVRRVEHRLQKSEPAAALSLMQHRYRRQGAVTDDLHSFLRALTSSDLVMMCGQGSINDDLKPHARQALGLLNWAQQLGIPTVVMDQGIGPLENPELVALARNTLPRAKLITIRERPMGAALLNTLGVSSDRVRVTGDAAVELARRLTPEKLGTGIGLSVRNVTYAKIDRNLIDVLRPAIQSYAREHGAPLVAIPIMRGTQVPDTVSIEELCRGYEGEVRGGSELLTPERTASAVHACRTVVTTTYHAAVFALSQGVPAICLANSEYYAGKFNGLADQFGVGCAVVMLNSSDVVQQLEFAMRKSWDSAENVRRRLLESADRQIGTSRSAYRELRLLQSARNETEPASMVIPRSVVRRHKLAEAAAQSP